jgi:hypothetical protein
MRLLLAILLTGEMFAADLPIREVILYKHGVGFFERSGTLPAGDTARLDFKAEDMNDVLKSLTITDRSGAKIGGVPFEMGNGNPLSVFLDQMKGARVDMKLGSETVSGVIVGARVVKGDEKSADRETVTLLTDAGEMRTFDFASASYIKFADTKLQTLMKDYLAVLSQARSKDRRTVYIDSTGSAARELVASYMTPRVQPSRRWKGGRLSITPPATIGMACSFRW